MCRHLITLSSLYLLISFIQETSAHGTLVDPIARNSLWRVDSSAPINYDDIELFCGGIGTIRRNGGRCGPCGDSYEIPQPRPHETGGFMVLNRTVKNYFPGSTIDVLVELDTNHGGYFEFELCRRDSFSIIETDDCFQKLWFEDGSERYHLRHMSHTQEFISLSLVIPQDLRVCEACILRWNYRAGNNWGICDDGKTGKGCGFQELYRNCADISIGYQINQWSSGNMKIRKLVHSRE